MKIPQIENAINSLLRRKNIQFQREFDAPFNVAGAILYGSRVRGNNRPDSDLDVCALTRDGTQTDTDTFREILASEIRPIQVDDFETFAYDRTDLGRLIFDKTGSIKGNYILVTPFQDVRATVEETIAKYQSLKRKR